MKHYKNCPICHAELKLVAISDYRNAMVCNTVEPDFKNTLWFWSYNYHFYYTNNQHFYYRVPGYQVNFYFANGKSYTEVYSEKSTWGVPRNVLEMSGHLEYSPTVLEQIQNLLILQ